MTNKNLNEELLKEQKYWVDNILSQYIKKNPALTYDGNSISRQKKGQILSHPFYMGLSDEYLNCEKGKRIMIVGREAMGYGKINDGTAIYDFINSCAPISGKENSNEPSNSQKWAIEYLRKQLYKENIKVPECFDEIKSNTSSFWNFFRLFKEQGYTPCWNNVDKVYFQTTLSFNAEELLSIAYEKDGVHKSLLQREIKICAPDYVLFATGAEYGKSIFTALQLKEESITAPVPEKSDRCLVKLPDIDGIPCYWIDHPRGLTAKCFNKQDLINYIIKNIN